MSAYLDRHPGVCLFIVLLCLLFAGWVERA